MKLNTKKTEGVNEFYDSWQFLYYHPSFKDKNGVEGFLRTLDIEVEKVNPKTKKIDLTDDSKNTLVEIWLECGSYYPLDENSGLDGWYHDPKLDCGGNTFEEAIIKLAKLVKKEYGDYKMELDL